MTSSARPIPCAICGYPVTDDRGPLTLTGGHLVCIPCVQRLDLHQDLEATNLKAGQ